MRTANEEPAANEEEEEEEGPTTSNSPPPPVASQEEEEGREAHHHSPGAVSLLTGTVSQDNDDEHEVSIESISALAKKEFDRPEFKSKINTPILIRDWSVKKEVHKGKEEEDGGAAPTTAGEQLQMAPNFASAVLGRWLANKVGLGGKKPVVPRKDEEDKKSSSSSSGGDDGFVVSNVNALLLPGQGTLILGPSSSGKTTLMRSLADKMSGLIAADDKNFEGSVMLGTVDPSTLCKNKNLSRTTCFVDQGDLSLTPILTVEETVRFARNCADGPFDELQDSMDAIFQLTGLDHVKSTVVGNADIRGVSGGQKRRVKILEMAVGRDVYLSFYDEITNGLDASSALTISKVLRIAYETMGSMGMTTLLQPSVEVFETFHRLILLNRHGQVAYSGPIDGAVTHFESLGLERPSGMNVPEFLLRCASSPSDFWDVSTGGEIPKNLSTAQELAKSFIDSDAGRGLLASMDRIEADMKQSGSGGGKDAELLLKLDAFAASTLQQIKLLVGRGWKLIARNPASIIRIISAIIFGVFIGTLFLNTPADANGTRTRAGYVLTLLFLVFLNSCMAPLDELYQDRNTFYTHRKASFYRTSSYYIAQVLCQAPVALVEAFLLSILSYFAVGMNTVQWWHFFYFWLSFTLVTLNGLSISRCLAYSLPTNDVAQTLGPAVLLLFILSTGYSPQYLQLPIWLRWLAWISPCAYAYEGAIVNEVYGRTVGDQPGTEFASNALGVPRIPYSSARPSMSTQGHVLAFDVYMLVIITLCFECLACILLHQSQKWYGPTTKRYQVASGMGLSIPPWDGVKKASPDDTNTGKVTVDAGDKDIKKSAIPAAPSAHLTARDIVYEVDVPIVEEESTDDKPTDTSGQGGHSSVALKAIEEDAESSLSIPLTAREYGQTRKGAATEWVLKRRLGEDAVSSIRSSTTSLPPAAEETKLDPPEPGRLRLLSGITASFAPGTLTALMGSSGAGKSTLLDVLAGYKTGGHILGEISINGRAKTDETWRSIAGYCEQVDLHNAAMSVRESIIFAARMRLRPFSIPDDEKVKCAQQILELLDLGDYADMLVGDEASGEGLPKHARKRLTVGVELAGNPSILFADEPTSGLDSLSAAVVVASLQRAAKQQGLTVVCTIHQPSREVFEVFDNLLLLRKGGVCVYNGALASLDSYLQAASNDNEYALPEEANPADHVLDVFCGPRGEKEDWGRLYAGSDMASTALASHTSCSCDHCKSDAIKVDTTPQGYWSELYSVMQRQMLAHWRTPSYMAIRFLWTIVASLLVGLVYFQAAGSGYGTDPAKAFNVAGSIFFFVNIAMVPLLSAMVPLITERAVYYREVASGTYRRAVYGIAVQVAELPFNLGAGAVSYVIFYFLLGLKLEAERAIYFLLMCLATYWLIPTLGQLLAFVSPNIGTAVGFGSLGLTLFTLTMGFLIPPNDIPPWWIWLYWINPLRYVLQGMVVNEVGGDGANGDAVLATLTWSYDDRWWYCFVAVLLFAVASGFGIVWATRISWLQR